MPQRLHRPTACATSRRACWLSPCYWGFYFVQLNAKVDRQREEAAERLALCRHLEAVVGATASSREALQETCKQLSEQLLKSTAPD